MDPLQMQALQDELARLRVAAFARLDAGDAQARAAMIDAADALEARGPAALALGRALVALDRGEKERALSALATCEQAGTDDPALARQIALTRARLALEHGQHDRVAEVLADLPDDDLDARVLRARATFHGGDPAGALAVLDAVLDAAPAHAEAHLGAGVCALALRRPGDALDHLRTACRLAPFDARPWRALVRTALLLGAVDDALVWARKILGQPLRVSPAALADLAELLICAGEGRSAGPLLQAAAATGRTGPAEAVALARLWAELGLEGAAAIETLAAAHRERPVQPLLDALAAVAADQDPGPALQRAANAGLQHWIGHALAGLHALAATPPDLAHARMQAEAIASDRRPEARLLQAALGARSDDPARRAAGRKGLTWAAGHAGLLPSVRQRARRELAATDRTAEPAGDR